MYHNPLLPSGSSSDDRKQDDRQHRKTKILITVGAIVALHVVPISGLLLLQGCKESGTESVVDSGTNEETLLADSNEANSNFENPEEDLLVADGGVPDFSIAETNEPVESAVSENFELPDGESSQEEPGDWDLGDAPFGESETPATEPEIEVVESPPPTAPTSHSLDYTIKRGDMLYSLAKKHGSTVEAILGANPGIDPWRLRIGMSIVIPRNADSLQSAKPSNGGGESPADGKVYSVERGDTLIRIARRNGITLQALREVNQLRSDKILIGQKLKIPAAEVASATAR